MRKYTYGPFQSRRLGLSLGISILSNYKICTYDCVYCEIGKTDKLVSPEFRIRLPPSPSFRKELKDILKYVPHLKSISFTGYNGEPTLNDNLLDFLKVASNVREESKWTQNKPLLTLFTNSSTLYLENIRNRVKKFDLVLAKLETAYDEDFQRTNKPHKECPKIETIIDSLVKLREEMSINHKLALQCLIYNSYSKDFKSNNNSTNILKLAEAVKRINPHYVQLYSIARIPAQYYVYSIDDERKREIMEIFKEILKNDDIKINYY